MGRPYAKGWKDGPREAALLDTPRGICVDPGGHLLFLVSYVVGCEGSFLCTAPFDNSRLK